MPTRSMKRNSGLSAGNCADDHERLIARCDGRWQLCIGRLVRNILAVGEKTDPRSSFQCHVFTHGATQHRITRFQRIEHSALCNYAVDVDRYLAATACECLQVVWKYNPYHQIVCASTDNTAGRSRTIASQLSPLSLDA